MKDYANVRHPPSKARVMPHTGRKGVRGLEQELGVPRE